MAGLKKRTISLETFETAVSGLMNAAFENDVYSPANFETQKRAIALLAFTPENKIPEEQSKAFEYLYSPEVCSVLAELSENEQYKDMMTAAENAIAHRLKITENTSFSATDRAVGRFFDILTEKVEALDGSPESIDRISKEITRLSEIAQVSGQGAIADENGKKR